MWEVIPLTKHDTGPLKFTVFLLLLKESQEVKVFLSENSQTLKFEISPQLMLWSSWSFELKVNEIKVSFVKIGANTKREHNFQRAVCLVVDPSGGGGSGVKSFPCQT